MATCLCEQEVRLVNRDEFAELALSYLDEVTALARRVLAFQYPANVA